MSDGGLARAPQTGVYGPEREWLIEGHGVEPDIVVDNLPHATFEGHDAQLERAVEHLKMLIEADPEAMNECQRIYGSRDDLTLMGTKEAALKNADALIVVTEWQQFRAPDFDLIQSELNTPVIFDGRNIYEPARLARKGITYYSIGRNTSNS